jgi:hypothetical protein
MTDTEKKGIVGRTQDRALTAVRNQLGAFLLVSAAFTLGYAVKNMEDRHERISATAELREQQKMMNASCDERVYQLGQAQQQQMLERDSRLSDQLDLIAEQKDMIAQLTKTTNTIATRQVAGLQQRRAELAVAKKAAEAATTAAKGVTDHDRAAINQVVKEKAK